MTNSIKRILFGGDPVPKDSGEVRRKGVANARLDSLYRQHYSEICASMRKRFGVGPPDPEDIVQTAFVRFAKTASFEKIQNPRAYIYRIARNLVLDHKRSASVTNAYIAEQIALDSELKLEGMTPERVLENKEQFEILIGAIKRLPKKQQVILILSRIEGKSYRQISAETGWSTGDISRNMQAGISVLIATLKREKQTLKLSDR